MLRRSAAALLTVPALLLAPLAGCSSDDPAPEPTAVSGEAAQTAADLVQTGLGQLAAGDDAAAEATFRAVLAIDARNAYAHYNLGYLAQAAGDESTALEEYDAALASDPDLIAALYNKAILRETDDLDESIRLYRRVVQLAPDNAAAQMRLGFALVHQGHQSAGEKALAAGLALDPAMADIEAPSYDD